MNVEFRCPECQRWVAFDLLQPFADDEAVKDYVRQIMAAHRAGHDGGEQR